LSTLSVSRALARYELPWLRLDWPVDWTKQFGRAAPLALELGFGNGAFLVEQAKRRPEWNWVGIERAWGSTQRLLRRLWAESLENVRSLEGDAPFLLETLFEPESVREIYVNFSDPWPKEKHHGRRLIQPAFIRVLGERLEPGGQAVIATDHADYAAWIADVLENQGVLESTFETSSVHELPDRTPTKYERKALARGAVIHYFVWRKARPTPDAAVEKEPLEDMPNAVLQGEAGLDALLAGWHTQTWQETHGDIQVVIKLLDVYRQASGDGGLFELLVKEGPLSQQLAVALYP